MNTIFNISRSLSMSYEKSKKGIKDFNVILSLSVDLAGQMSNPFEEDLEKIAELARYLRAA